MPAKSEPTPEQLRHTVLRGEVRRARDVMNAAASALSHIDQRLGIALDKASTSEERDVAYDEYERALTHLVTSAKFLDVQPWPHPHPNWRVH